MSGADDEEKSAGNLNPHDSFRGGGRLFEGDNLWPSIGDIHRRRISTRTNRSETLFSRRRSGSGMNFPRLIGRVSRNRSESHFQKVFNH